MNRLAKRRSAAWPLALLGLLVAALPASAALVEDASVTVTVRAASTDGSTAGAPLEDAAVTLISYVNDFDDPLQVVTGTTDATGVATITGVAREDGAGPTVYLAVEGFRQDQTTDPTTGCTDTTTWFGLVSDRAVDGSSVAIDVEVTPSSSVSCPQPGVPLRGSILGPGGTTLERAFGWVTVATADEEEGQPLDVEPDGAFEVRLPELGTWTSPATVVLEFVSLPTRFETFGDDCVRTFAQAITWSGDFALAEGQVPQQLPLVTSELMVGEQCGATGEGPGEGPGEEPGEGPGEEPGEGSGEEPGEGSGEAPGSETGGGAPGATLPPTDADGAAPASGARTGGPAVGLLGVALAVLVFVAGAALLAAPARRRRS